MLVNKYLNMNNKKSIKHLCNYQSYNIKIHLMQTSRHIQARPGTSMFIQNNHDNHNVCTPLSFLRGAWYGGTMYTSVDREVKWRGGGNREREEKEKDTKRGGRLGRWEEGREGGREGGMLRRWEEGRERGRDRESCMCILSGDLHSLF